MHSSQAHGLVHQYENLHSINETCRHNPRTNYSYQRQFHSITPWDDEEKNLGGITRFNYFQQNIQDHTQKIPPKVQQRKQVLNFIQKHEKRGKSGCEVRNSNKKNQIRKETYYQLNTKKIQFKQCQKKGAIHLIQNPNQPAPNFQAKNPTNNLFIKSQLFRTDRLKTLPKERPQSQQARKKNQYQIIREIKSPSFLAIRSVDLQEKFLLKDRNEGKQKEENEMSMVSKDEKQKLSNFHTISVLGSRRNSWRATSRSLHHKSSSIKQEVDIEKSVKKIIKSAQDSSKQMSDSIKGKYRMAIEEIARKAKCNNSPDIIATNLSFIKKTSPSKEENQKKSSTLNIPATQSPKNQSKEKRTALTRERVSRIQRLKGMKTHNKFNNSFQQDLTPYLEQKTLITQRKKVNSSTLQATSKFKTDSPLLEKRVGTAELSPRKWMTVDRSAEKERFQLKTFNDLISLMKAKSNKC